MIESVLIDGCLLDEFIAQYCNGNMFVNSAPEGTTTPYIVIDAGDEFDETGAISAFDVTVNIYDVAEDKRPQRQASKKIIDALNYDMFCGDGYTKIRLYFRNRVTIREPESTLTRVMIQFDARACNDDIIEDRLKTLFENT